MVARSGQGVFPMKLRSIVSAMACLALSMCLVTAYSPSDTAFAASGDTALATGKVAAQATAKKAKNPLKVRVTKLGINGKVLKSKAKTVKVLTVSKAKGKKSYKVAKWTTKKAKKYFKVSKKTGAVKVKKGTPTGTYKFKVKVTAAGNKSYKKGSKTVTVKIVVKSKTWVPEKGHWEYTYKTVVDQEAYTTTTRVYFTQDGWSGTDRDEACAHQIQAGGHVWWEDITEKHPAVTHQEQTGKKWIVDVPGHWK